MHELFGGTVQLSKIANVRSCDIQEIVQITFEFQFELHWVFGKCSTLFQIIHKCFAIVNRP